MNVTWLRFAVYLDGMKRFDANPSGELTAIDAYERMRFVFDNIEYCFAEGRLLDIEIFDLLEDFGDQIRRNDVPPVSQIADLASRISSRYGFDPSSISDSIWIQREDSGQCRIWIDQAKRIAESNEYLFGQIEPKEGNIG